MNENTEDYPTTKNCSIKKDQKSTLHQAIATASEQYILTMVFVYRVFFGFVLFLPCFCNVYRSSSTCGPFTANILLLVQVSVLLFGSNLVAVYTSVPAYLQSLSRSTLEFLNNVHLSITYTVIRIYCNVYTLASKFCSYEMIHSSLPQFFCSMVVFLCYYPCLVSLLFTGPSLLVVKFHKKIYPQFL